MKQLKDSIISSTENEVLNLANFNQYKSLKCFSRITARSFALLSSGISKTLIKQDTTILSSKAGTLNLNDPLFYLLLDLIGRNKNIVLYSSQSSEEELVSKLILSLAGLNEMVLKKGALINSTDAINDFSKASTIVYNSKLKIIKGSILSSLWNELINLNNIDKLDYILIDYLEALSVLDTKSMQDLLEYFNDLAKHLEVQIILFSRV